MTRAGEFKAYFANADDVIARYLTGTPDPSDYRTLFAAILMQAKKDIFYQGSSGRILRHTLDAIQWVRGHGDPAGITFRMCCEALNITEKFAASFLSTAPYKRSRPCNGRNARLVNPTPPSVRTSSRSKQRSSPSTTRIGSVSYAAKPRSSSSNRMSL